jgi:hypothetical protein
MKRKAQVSNFGLLYGNGERARRLREPTEDEVEALREAAAYVVKMCEQGGPRDVTNWDWAVSRLARATEAVGDHVVARPERVSELAGLLGCAGSTLGGRANGFKLHEQSARVYDRLIDALGPVFNEDALRKFLRGDRDDEPLGGGGDDSTLQAPRDG